MNQTIKNHIRRHAAALLLMTLAATTSSLVADTPATFAVDFTPARKTISPGRLADHWKLNSF